MFIHECGLEARDKITGIKGIIVGRANYLFGCNQYGLAQRVEDDGKKRDTEWFDEGRIEIVGRGILPKEVKAKRNGADINRDHPV